MTNLLSRAFWDISYYLHQGILNEYSFSFLKFIICVELVRQNYQTHVLLCINILNKHKPSKKDTSGIISGSKMTPKNILRIIAWLNTYFNKNFNSFQPLPVDLVSFPVQKLVQKSSSRMIQQVTDLLQKHSSSFRLLPVGPGSSGHHQKFRRKILGGGHGGHF